MRERSASTTLFRVSFKRIKKILLPEQRRNLYQAAGLSPFVLGSDVLGHGMEIMDMGVDGQTTHLRGESQNPKNLKSREKIFRVPAFLYEVHNLLLAQAEEYHTSKLISNIISPHRSIFS